MKKHLKYIGYGLLLGLFIALLIESVSLFLNIERDLVTNVAFAIGFALLISGLLYNYFYIRKYRKRVINQIWLLESGKPEIALNDMISMHEEATSKGAYRLAHLAKLNMTAAYCDLNKYEEALDILLELSSVKFEGIENLVYRINLCACYYYLGNEEGGNLNYLLNEKLFDKYRNNIIYGGNVAVIKMMYLLANHKYKEAKSLLEQAKIKWDNPRLLNDYQLIEEKLRLSMEP